MKTIDLSGTWKCAMTPDADRVYDFVLPGSACENKIGEKCIEYDEMTRESVRCLRQRYSYTGALWLEREIDIPEEFVGKYVTLYMERVNIASELWIDDNKVDRQIIEITTPHIYNISGIKAGTHKFTIKIDNSNLLNIDGMASGYSDDTQSIWLGIIGKIEVRCEEIFHIDNIQVYPKENSADVRVTVCSDCAKPDDRRTVHICMNAVSPDGEKLGVAERDAVLFNKKQVLHFEYPMNGDIKYWDEFNPVLYKMNVSMAYEDTIDEKTFSFGMRTICVKDKQFTLNGRPIALRGTLDCGIYPLTGYPPTDLETWLNTCRTVKEYGLNHIRFHAWCPPEAAFVAADMTGIYVSAEMPLWLNVDVCALATGDDPVHRQYYTMEALNISREYGNHPSFIMFSNGNELLGDFEMLEDITTQIKALDSRRLYTMTSNFDHPVAPVEDYLCAFEASGHRVRLQVFHDVVSEHTKITYDDAVRDTPVPVVSFEVGQYCVYPDVDSVKDYTGNLAPVNFEVIKKHMLEKNVYRKLDRYIKASGKFSVLMYKEDIEASLRTHKMGGFELLGISDYTGQCTATIGFLDVFWKSKGLITPEEFKRFCSPTVPLIKMNRIFYNHEIFEAEFDIYNYSNDEIINPLYNLKFVRKGEVIKKIETRQSKVSFALDFITEPSEIEVVLSVGDKTNSWKIFVYPAKEAENKVEVVTDISKIDEIISEGRNAIVMGTKENLAHPIDGLFKPVFWSPAYFVSDRACGLWCDNEHPIYNGFPTDDFTDFQWKHPIDNSVGADVSALPDTFDVLLEPVPNFFNNTQRSPLFEAKIGNSSILFCGFNLELDDKATTALKASIYNYVNSAQFKPKHSLTVEQFKSLFK